MDRLARELYLDRLDRHAARLRDELEAARLRIAFATIERAAARRLSASQRQLLASVGVLGDHWHDEDEQALIDRRTAQLEALDRLRQGAAADAGVRRARSSQPARS